MHPLSVLVYVAGVFALLFSLFHPVLLGLQAVVTLAVLLTYGNRGAMLKKLAGFLGIALVIALLGALFDHRGTYFLFYLFGNPITLEAVVNGALGGLMILTMLMVFSAFNVLLDGQKLLYLLCRPLPKTGLTLYMILRYSHLLGPRAAEIMQTHRSRFEPDSGLIPRLRQLAGTLKVLCAWSLEDGLLMGLSIRASGYGTQKRSAYTHYSFATADAAFIAAALCCLALVFTATAGGTANYAVFPQLQPVLVTPRLATAAALASLYTALPLCTELILNLSRGIRHAVR